MFSFVCSGFPVIGRGGLGNGGVFGYLVLGYVSVYFGLNWAGV